MDPLYTVTAPPNRGAPAHGRNQCSVESSEFCCWVDALHVQARCAVPLHRPSIPKASPSNLVCTKLQLSSHAPGKPPPLTPDGQQGWSATQGNVKQGYRSGQRRLLARRVGTTQGASLGRLGGSLGRRCFTRSKVPQACRAPSPPRGPAHIAFVGGREKVAALKLVDRPAWVGLRFAPNDTPKRGHFRRASHAESSQSGECRGSVNRPHAIIAQPAMLSKRWPPPTQCRPESPPPRRTIP